MSVSPLAEVVRDRRINAILEAIRQAVANQQPITIRPKDVDYIRRSFSKGLELGERRLYELARFILDRFAPGRKVRITLIIWGRCPVPGHEGVVELEADLPTEPEQLMMKSDSHLIEPHKPKCPLCGQTVPVIASFVRHTPEPDPKDVLQFLFTRIKTTSNICYKIADLVFDIDFMFQRDKIYNEFSQMVGDVYGIKIIVAGDEHIPVMLRFIRELKGAVVVDEKDYTGANRKKSGYEARKVVIRREHQLFEIQIQSHRMYDFEQTSRTASHRTYKEIQMQDRRKLGKEYVALYQALSGLLKPPDQNFSSIEYIEIGQDSKGLDDEF
ncbi:MAG: hypothetical protein V1798_09670 [Pseudomonadota bacterium]